MSNASFKMNGVEVLSENAQTVTVKNINVDANDTTTPSMCKAWVNFDGTLAMTVGSSYGPNVGNVNPIRAAYNVASITDNGTGDYTVNFATAMPDANYCVVLTGGRSADTYNHGGDMTINGDATPLTTTSARINSYRQTSGSETANDVPFVCAGIFR